MDAPGKEQPEAEIPRHGGDLAFATRHFGSPPGGWLDLSTGINPNPFLAPAMPPSLLSRLPDRDALDRLLAAARSVYGAKTNAGLAAVPGTEVSVRLMPTVAPPGPVAIVGPTYGSHRDAWVEAGRQISEVRSIHDVGEAAVVVLGNPNNPDGRTWEPGALRDLARTLGTRKGMLVVDEAFADVAPEVSIIPLLSNEPAVVLRSFGKFYGLAGIRLGFVVGEATLVGRIASLLGDWPVSAAAIAIGCAALADGEWRERKRRRLAYDADRLRKVLARHRLDVKGGTSLFTLVADVSAAAIHRALAERGIWTRVFEGEPTWLRFGLPTEEGFARLDRALSEFR